MSSLKRQYVMHYLKSNYRILLLTIIVQMLILQDILNPMSVVVHMVFGLGSMKNMTAINLEMLLECICVMAFFIPLYQFRFLMKRSSSDLYLSLPIKREDFFRTQFCIGALILVVSTLVSLFCSSLLSLSIGYVFTSLLQICVLEVMGLVLYSLFTWIIVKCNTVFDGIMICGAYTLLPCLVLLTLYMFTERSLDAILISNSYGVGEVVNSDMFFLAVSFLSTPLAMMSLIDETLFSYAGDVYTLLLLIVYWLAIGIGTYMFAKKAYVHRKGELSGERTRSFISYPIMIPLFTLCLIFLVGVSVDTFLFLVFIFLAYTALYFLAKRKVKLTLFMVVQFLCLLSISFATEQGLVKSQFLNRIQETYELVDVDNESLDIQLEHISIDESGNRDVQLKYYKSRVWYVLKEHEKQALIEAHKEIVSYCITNKLTLDYRYSNEKEQHKAYVSFQIKLDANDKIYRDYTIQSEAENLFINEKIKELIELGVLEEVDESDE